MPTTAKLIGIEELLLFFCQEIKIHCIWLKFRDGLYTHCGLTGAPIMCTDRFWLGLLGEKGSDPGAALRPHPFSALCSSSIPEGCL